MGARLEAEEILRKKRAAALLESAIKHQGITPRYTPSPVDEPTTSARHGKQQHQQQPERLSSSESRPQHAPGGDNGHHQPYIMTDLDTKISSAAATTAPMNTGAIAAASACTSHGEGSPPGERHTGHGAAPVVLSSLRQREHELPSRVAVLDDRMTRARPTGLLAKETAAAAVVPLRASVSVSAVVADSSPLAQVLPSTSANPNNDGSPLTGAAEGAAVALIATFPNVGKPCREDFLVDAFLGNSSTAASTAVTATPDRYRHGQRRRRMSVPQLLPLDVNDDDTGDTADGGTRHKERRRPWTTPYGEGVADELEGEGGVAVRAFR